MKTNRTQVEIPEAVEHSIRKHYKEGRADGVFAALEWSHINKCFFFWLDGMYVGVELDGYIHT